MAITTTERTAQHECRIVTEHRGATCLVRVKGQLDWATGAGLRDQLRDSCSEPSVIIDLTDMTSLDSVGTGILLAAVARADHRAQRLALVTDDPATLEVLLCTGLGLVVPIVATSDDAVRLLGRPAGPDGPADGGEEPRS